MAFHPPAATSSLRVPARLKIDGVDAGSVSAARFLIDREDEDVRGYEFSGAPCETVRGTERASLLVILREFDTAALDAMLRVVGGNVVSSVNQAAFAGGQLVAENNGTAVVTLVPDASAAGEPTVTLYNADIRLTPATSIFYEIGEDLLLALNIVGLVRDGGDGEPFLWG